MAVKCILRLYKYCHIFELLKEQNHKDVSKFGTSEWLRAYCSFCIKSIYAKRFKTRVKYTVVNTL